MAAFLCSGLLSVSLTPLSFSVTHAQFLFQCLKHYISLQIFMRCACNFTSSEKPFQTDQAEVTTAHLPRLPFWSAGCWENEFVFLLCWLSQVPLECTLSESKGLLFASYHIPSLWDSARHTVSSQSPLASELTNASILCG